MSSGALIIGAGQAGAQIAVSLRELGYQNPIRLIGEEEWPPYQRPPLSKTFLMENISEEHLHLRTAQFYDDHSIELLYPEPVVKATVQSDGTPGTVTTSTGRELRFDGLAFAVGAENRQLRAPGSHLEGISYLRDLRDALNLRKQLAGARSVVVVGGGFIGLEAAAVGTTLGKRVTVVEAADRLLGRGVGEVVSAFYQAAHERRGVDIRLGTEVAEFSGTARKLTAVVLSDGTEIPCDVAIIGIGVVPRTALAESIGAVCRGGIVVDEFARTSVPGVVAAGDCTIGGHVAAGSTARMESVQNATDQAKVAAASLAGRQTSYNAVPFFWSDQGDLKLQIAGWSADHDQYVVRGRPDEERFAVLYYRAGRLVAVDAIHSPHDFMAVRRALNRGQTIDPADAADPSRPLKHLLID